MIWEKPMDDVLKSRISSIGSIVRSISSQAGNLSSLCRSVLTEMLRIFNLSRGAVLIYEDVVLIDQHSAPAQV
ncbi:TPA: hypothetical protein ENG04_01035, partial [Candidatus Poribacteria bacterium]|nr:hypothetical protein [Candidatus Poribacteria bacterium]HEX28649.1 hypothetical protein [Candidatus Poribacteria bacterium]